jgi:hypothetical protein
MRLMGRAIDDGDDSIQAGVRACEDVEAVGRAVLAQA